MGRQKKVSILGLEFVREVRFHFVCAVFPVKKWKTVPTPPEVPGIVELSSKTLIRFRDDVLEFISAKKMRSLQFEFVARDAFNLFFQPKMTQTADCLSEGSSRV